MSSPVEGTAARSVTRLEARSREHETLSSTVVLLTIGAVVITVLAAITFSAQAAVQQPSTSSAGHHPVRRPGQAQPPTVTPALTFGIYPGGGAGTVGPAGRTVAEDPAKRLAALRQLRVPGRPFVLHIFASYTGPQSVPPAEQVGHDIAVYTAAGFQVELVLTYRPADGAAAADVAGFADFARSALASFGSNPRFVALQVTNEANVQGAPGAADGAYAGAEDALVQGVVAAKAEARTRGFDQVRVGFNWAYSSGPRETAFWSRLGRVGGATFRNSLDWVGLDLYPETWGPTVRGDLAAATRETVLAALTALRSRYMPLADLSSGIPLHISENGYPTGPGRTEAMQVTVMKAAVSTVDVNRSTYHVTDYRWFDLRDANSSSAGFESRYGLMRDDYTPKAAFAAYRHLVAAFGGPPPERRASSSRRR